MSLASEKETLIENRLKNAFSPTFLEVRDESDAHQGHPGYQGGQRHFMIVIKAACLEELPRVDAYRQIYSQFNDMFPSQIHALSIKILK